MELNSSNCIFLLEDREMAQNNFKGRLVILIIILYSINMYYFLYR